MVELFQRIFNNHTPDFPYFIAAAILGLTFVVGLLKHKSFVWRT